MESRAGSAAPPAAGGGALLPRCPAEHWAFAISASVRVIALVREPVARLLSSFSMTHQMLLRSANHSRALPLLAELASCPLQHDFQVAFLAGKRTRILPLERLERASARGSAQARSSPSRLCSRCMPRLRCELPGTAELRATARDLEAIRAAVSAGALHLLQTERFADDIARLAAALGWPRFNRSEAASLSPRRVSSTSPTRSWSNRYKLSAAELPPALHAQLRAQSTLDLELHALAGRAKG